MPGEGFEPPTFGLQNRCTTTVLTRHGWLTDSRGLGPKMRPASGRVPGVVPRCRSDRAARQADHASLRRLRQPGRDQACVVLTMLWLRCRASGRPECPSRQRAASWPFARTGATSEMDTALRSSTRRRPDASSGRRSVTERRGLLRIQVIGSHPRDDPCLLGHSAWLLHDTAWRHRILLAGWSEAGWCRPPRQPHCLSLMRRSGRHTSPDVAGQAPVGHRQRAAGPGHG